ncbi:MAG: bifunctional precorrin-2 dehydrogenase/sirohydrochlorin ferrochelatase [Gammaproteobacteria bacterium]|nr:MAG: bifunctional precorrin-2 dehydrogenase/sirohydrochlorin ferrochelatase [Gammaproteobacteria bacterium]
MTSKPKLFPLMVDLSDKSIIIMGAGSVAERKVNLLLDYLQGNLQDHLQNYGKGKLSVISNRFSPTLLTAAEDNPALSLITEDLEQLSDKALSKLLADAFLVIPATSDKQLNGRIAHLASQQGTLVNPVDSVGEVTIPSIISQDDLLISISTQGSSPALAKFTRQKIEQLLTPQYPLMAKLQSEIRIYLKKQVSDQALRKQIIWEILNSKEVWNSLSESYEMAKQSAYKIIANHTENLSQ